MTMRRRYIPRAAIVSNEMGYQASTADTVFCGGDEPRRTGLLDINGNELFRINEREPIGFRLPHCEEER